VAKFLCVCGWTIRTSGPIPNPDEWDLWRDDDLWAFQEATTEAEIDRLGLQHGTVFRCPKSDHLFIWWQPMMDGEPTVYAPMPEG
jgi:hypothetical protein